VVSILSYLKSEVIHIFFMTLGFMRLVVAEYVYLLNSIENFNRVFISNVNIEISHIMLLIMVIFFGISFMKNPMKI
jgi:hypothetical protein